MNRPDHSLSIQIDHRDFIIALVSDVGNLVLLGAGCESNDCQRESADFDLACCFTGFRIKNADRTSIVSCGGRLVIDQQKFGPVRIERDSRRE